MFFQRVRIRMTTSLQSAAAAAAIKNGRMTSNRMMLFISSSSDEGDAQPIGVYYFAYFTMQKHLPPLGVVVVVAYRRVGDLKQ